MRHDDIPYRDKLASSLVCVLVHSSHQVRSFEPTIILFQTSQLRPPRRFTCPILGILHVPPTYTAQHDARVSVCVELGDKHIKNHDEGADAVLYAFCERGGVDRSLLAYLCC